MPKFNVLLLEDSVIGGRVLTQMLLRVGAEDVYQVRSLQDADVELDTDNNDYTVCVLDVNIGQDDCRTIYQRAIEAELPVMLISGSSPSAHFDLGNPLVAFLPKPITIDSLKHTLQQLGFAQDHKK